MVVKYLLTYLLDYLLLRFAFWSFRDIPIILSNFLLLLLHHYIQLHTYTPTLLSLIINLVSNFFCLLFLFLPQVSSVFFAGNSWPQITRYSGWRYNNFTVAELKALKVPICALLSFCFANLQKKKIWALHFSWPTL